MEGPPEESQSDSTGAGQRITPGSSEGLNRGNRDGEGRAAQRESREGLRSGEPGEPPGEG